MPIPRRTVLAATLAAVCAPTLARLPRRRRASPIAWQKLRDDAIATTGMDTGGNVLALRSGDAVLIVDAKFAPLAPTLRHDAEQALAARAAMLINTHHHADHTSGNIAFADMPRIAHANADARIRAQVDRYRAQLADTSGLDGDARQRARTLAESHPDATPDLWAPTQTLAPAFTHAVIDFQDTPVHLHHVTPGHTDNDLFIHIPDHNIIHAGDLLFNDTWPFIDRPAGASTRGWIISCRRILDLCDNDTIVIPGHGRIDNRDAVARQIAFFEHMRDAARKAIANATSRDDFINTPTPYDDRLAFERIRARALGAIYDEVREGV